MKFVTKIILQYWKANRRSRELVTAMDFNILLHTGFCSVEDNEGQLFTQELQSLLKYTNNRERGRERESAVDSLIDCRLPIQHVALTESPSALTV